MGETENEENTLKMKDFLNFHFFLHVFQTFLAQIPKDS